MKITKFFALMCAAAAFALAGCEGIEGPSNDGDNNGGNNNGGNNNGGGNTTSDLVLSAEETTIALGEDIVLNVTEGGVDVTSASDCVIYDYKTMEPVTGSTLTPDSTGVYSFFATKGSKSSNTLYVTVLANVPTLPEDTDAANTKFNHRILLVDHTGISCGNCPNMMDNLRALHNTEWKNSYNEVTCHGGGYANGDPARSAAATVVDDFYSPSGYPVLNVNFYNGIVENYSGDYFLKVIGEKFTQLIKKDGADAGIAIATTGDPTIVYASVAVKAAVEAEYKVTAWLLENNIYGNQYGASEDYHRIYNHALRNIGGPYSKSDLAGNSVGIIKAGETAETGFEMEVKSNWKHENMEVLVIVSAKNKANRWEVVNTALCPVNESAGFEYLQ